MRRNVILELTQEEREILDGAQGRAAAKAMQILVALGTIYGAQRMLPVSSVQIAGRQLRQPGRSRAGVPGRDGSRRRASAGAGDAQPGRHGRGKLAGAGHQPRICRPATACHRCLRPHERHHHLHLHPLPDRQPAALRRAHRLGGEQRGLLCQFGAGRAHQPRGRAERPGSRPDRSHARLWLPPG